MPENLRSLQALRLTARIDALQDVRNLPSSLLWSTRINDVAARDAEIIGRYVGHAQIADLIADDAAAVVYGMGKYTFETTSIPNLKVGANLTQEDINQIMGLTGDIPGDDLSLDATINRILDALLLGVRQRREALLTAMLIDGLTYDRLGIKISAGWGMPADLKITVSITWDNASTATPVADLLNAKLIARTRYGIEYNRVTMSTTDFRYMIATTEYQNKAKQFIPAQLAFTNLQTLNLTQMQTLAEATIGMTIELNDGRYWSQDASGTPASYAFHPVGKVILTDSGNDNSDGVWDFANAVVTESLVSQVAGNGVIGGLGGPQRGPLAYATLANGQLNPPGLTMWGVQRGFPRKFMLQSSAVLTVGTYSDSISVSDVF
jgi:hypothetical protein